jgi:hypothetical protein
MKLDKNVILYEGTSNIDGSPIVVIATKNSKNAKTGNMIQTWIIRSDIDPLTAIKTGCDYSICGNCPHRGHNGKKRSCYVQVYQAPLSVYRAYKRGVYKVLSPADYAQYFNGYHLRIGSYGDPAMVPSKLWRTIIQYTAGHTGYTHQWRELDDGKSLKGIVQASCDNLADYIDAKKQGWHTFRVTIDEEKKQDNEIICLNLSNGLTCEKCGRCNGCSRDIVIRVHGFGKNNFKDVA